MALQTAKYKDLPTDRYVDLDLTFALNANTKDVSVKKNDASIKQALKVLILTGHYERPFHPELGSGVYDLLFEPVTPLTAILIEKKISEVIENFEPRIEVESLSVDPRPDSNAFDVTLVYYLINVLEPVTLSFVLKRVR